MNKTVVSLAGAALLLVACSRPAPPEEPVRAVKVITVGASAYSPRHEYAGEVRAQVESRLGFRIGGKLVKRQAELGQQVRAGQVLAQLDPQDYRLAAEAGRAQVAAAATNRNLAAADFKRYQVLKDQNFISGAELERREAALKAAQAQLEQAQSQSAVQGNQTGYAVLTADVSGVVTAVEAEAGQVVAAGATVLRIAADGVRDVVFSVPEDKVTSIKPGAPVRIRVWAQDSELTGKVREVAASSDPVTRTYPVKVSIEGKAPPLGATVYAILGNDAATGAPVIKLPTSALRQEGQGTAVWVLDKASMTVRSQVIQVATADSNEVVVGSGLTPGMLVVSAGVHVLSPGQKVSIYESKMPSAQAGRVQSAPDSIAKPALAAPAASASGTK
ncbi:Probable Co/Zn/Cd efflux system membrane fusion protein [Polaromonas sp. CG9_12]|uniref:efflux RND transporter periplasmic adaptor subunit n=1 Tax=Polaromonas sp. CG_9.11 TaxID=2787730 RepID=UPI0004DDCB50|nr:efflux RND transporter periplasmic adaptor subunit [Polaromonas sp. CG_9.11]MBG6076969.1 RND family efflux transporter MFP subunit [Polaromonas sp. CG_9.11]CDS54141.1 Probable Co/Zn/Cd efflux system membrane fusion protein [Polaromonas sp. CG9_12]